MSCVPGLHWVVRPRVAVCACLLLMLSLSLTRPATPSSYKQVTKLLWVTELTHSH